MRLAVSAGSVVLVMAAAPALAGGMAEPQPEPVVVPTPTSAPVGYDWTGPYVGAQLEYGDVTVEDGAGTEVDDGTGALYGLFGGYRYDFGNVVLGGELDLNAADIDLPRRVAGSLDAVYRAGLEAGFEAGPTLIYGTLGYAYAEVRSDGVDLDDDGYFFGVGVDYAVTEQITVGGEVLQHEFEDFDGTGLDIDATTIGVNAAFRF